MNQIVVEVEHVIKRKGYLVFDFDTEVEANKFLHGINFEGNVFPDIDHDSEVFETVENSIIYEGANYIEALLNYIITGGKEEITDLDIDFVNKYYTGDDKINVMVKLYKLKNTGKPLEEIETKNYSVEIYRNKLVFEHKIYGEEDGGVIIVEDNNVIEMDGCQVIPIEIKKLLSDKFNISDENLKDL